MRAPPLPPEAHPAPPDHPPGYIPAPPGIRAVYTTPSVLLRGHPEMNRHRRLIPRLPPRNPGKPPHGPEEVMSRCVIVLDDRPEINPVA